MPDIFDPTEHPHRRFNPLTKSWVLCSPHRTKRPWQGAVEPVQLDERPKYDPKCYLCPGNSRAGGLENEKYETTFVFENDFAAVKDDPIPEPLVDANDPSSSLFQTQPARGKCFVICFNPRHDLTIAQMSKEELVSVLTTWQKLYKDVSEKYDWIRYIQIFENKGAMMGCSNPHPHGQSWTLDYIPTFPAQIYESFKEFAHDSKNTSLAASVPRLENGLPSLLLTYVNSELSKPSERIIIHSKHFVFVTPFWAVWPYETMIIPYKRQIKNLLELTEEEKEDLSDVLGRATRRMDNLFKTSFPYSMGIYQQPSLNDPSSYGSYAHLFFGFYPPLLRSATVKKFLVGFELFAEAQRDITPEQAAQKLRDVGEKDWRDEVRKELE